MSAFICNIPVTALNRILISTSYIRLNTRLFEVGRDVGSSLETLSQKHIKVVRISHWGELLLKCSSISAGFNCANRNHRKAQVSESTHEVLNQTCKILLKINICAVVTMYRLSHFVGILQCWRSTLKLEWYACR